MSRTDLLSRVSNLVLLLTLLSGEAQAEFPAKPLKPEVVSGESELLVIEKVHVPDAKDAPKTEEPDPLRPGVVRVRVGEFEKLLQQEEAGLTRRVHLHRNYFNGPKEYQSTLLRGGWVQIRARHPCKPDEGFINSDPVVLPEGLPIIVYTEESITYVYEEFNRRFVFSFHAQHPEKICSCEVKGIGKRRRVSQFGETVTQFGGRVRSRAEQVPLTESVRTNARLVRDTARGAAGTAIKLASMWMDKVGQAAGALPGIQTLRSAGQQSGEGGGQIEQLRQQGLEAARSAQKFRVSRP